MPIHVSSEGEVDLSWVYCAGKNEGVMLCFVRFQPVLLASNPSAA